MIRRLIYFTGVALIALTVGIGNTEATALTSKPTLNWLNAGSLTVQAPSLKIDIPAAVKPPDPKPPEPTPAAPVNYTVVSGDNLTQIADSHSTTWLRIWNKNPALTNPDLILPGQVFLIPDASEQVADRAVPAAVVQQMAPQAAARAPIAGNGYDAGYCTWYVKNRRPDLPNNLGNANTWYSQASAQGYQVGLTPRAGAVGTTTRGSDGHVVYVESVNSDGSVIVTEMNYAGLYSLRTRTASASEFSYIY